MRLQRSRPLLTRQTDPPRPLRPQTPRPAACTAPRRRSRLSFHLSLRSDTRMDPDLETVIRQALADARAAGKDYFTQTELAVRAVLQARPDMTASEALSAVELVLRS